MQGELVQRFVQEKLIETHDIIQKDDRLPGDHVPALVFDDVAEFVAGYTDCIEEALNYLKEVERYPDDHPAIIDLVEHLAVCKTQFLRQTIKNSSDRILLSFLPSSS